MDVAEKIINKAEKLGWKVRKAGFIITNDENVEHYVFSNKPDNQSTYYNMSIAANGANFIESINEFYEEFDVSLNAYCFMDENGHGVEGVPYDMKELYESMEKFRDMIKQLTINLAE